jgi:hypothetical protein
MKPRITPFMAPYGIKLLMLAILLHISASVCQAYTLTVTPKPTNGTVTSSVGGINCGSGGYACTSTSISAGTSVTLTANTPPTAATLRFLAP